MIFKEHGNIELPTIIIFHGGGLSEWSLENLVSRLKNDFHIITPIIDGHGEDSNTEFISIESSAQKLLRYIDEKCNKKIFAVAGLSLGAQIVVELISQRKDISDYAVIESALVFPIKGINTYVKFYKPFYSLIKKKWFSKLQAKSLLLQEALIEKYYEDSKKMSYKTLINIAISNGNYSIKDGLKDCRTKALIITGSKELNLVKNSAKKLHETIPMNEVYIAGNMKHGELSLVHPEEYLNLIKSFFNKKIISKQT